MPDHLQMLDRIRPRDMTAALHEADLRRRAQKYGADVTARPFDEIQRKLKLLDAATREHVVSHLARGLPVAVYRPSQAGEPAGGIPMAFLPVRLGASQ